MAKLRRDAEANREEILAAAEGVFAAHGVTAPLDLICQAAGVGRATLYRHFPDRHQLLLALLDLAVAATRRRAEQLADRDDGLFELLLFQAERISQRSSLIDYWRVIDATQPELTRARAEFRAIFAPLIARTIAANLCRPDLTSDDVPLLTSMLGAALRGRGASEQTALGLRAYDLLRQGLLPRDDGGVDA